MSFFRLTAGSRCDPFTDPLRPALDARMVRDGLPQRQPATIRPRRGSLMPALEYSALPAAIGTKLGPSRWISIPQSRINAFADATEDHQWIHVDVARAGNGPFGGATIGHGYLTMSLISAYLEEILEVEGADSVINYGADRVRFPSPVPVDSHLRAAAEIVDVTIGAGWSQLTVRVTVESNRGERPACVADVLIRYLAPKENP